MSNRVVGPDRRGGRLRTDPNEMHPYTIGEHYKIPKTAAQRAHTKGGKVHQSVELAPIVYDKIREEAIERKIPMARLLRELINAGLALSEDGE